MLPTLALVLPRKFRLGYGTGIDWSPDGKWIAASGKESEEESDAIYLSAVESDGARRLTSPPAG